MEEMRDVQKTDMEWYRLLVVAHGFMFEDLESDYLRSVSLCR